MFGAFGWLAVPEAAELSEELEREPSKVVGYRFERLFRAGFEVADARLIARRGDIDLHYALELIGRCADSEQARRILA
jgi:hypothetical protein